MSGLSNGRFAPSRAPSEYADRYAPTTFGRQPRRLRNTHIRGGIATRCKRREVCASSVTVSTAMPQFHPAAYGESPHRNRRRKWRPHIVAILHQTIEQRAFVRCLRKRPRLRSNGSGEKKWCGVSSSPAVFLSGTSPWSFAGTIRWYVVAVENRHELAFGIFQRLLMLPAFACS